MAESLVERRQQFQQTHGIPPSDGTLYLLDRSEYEARRFQIPYIGPEHLFLGSFLTPESRIPLKSLGLDLDKTRSAVEFMVGRGDALTMPPALDLTPRAKNVVRLGLNEAIKLEDTHYEPEHVLLGIAKEGESIAAGVLALLGITLDKLYLTVVSARQHRQGIKREISAIVASNPLQAIALARAALIKEALNTSDKLAMVALLDRLSNP